MAKQSAILKPELCSEANMKLAPNYCKRMVENINTGMLRNLGLDGRQIELD